MRVIAFYLPQFHPIPENDQAWGNGFTEWTNVVRAKPIFTGHYQPHLPADLGFYDLRVPEVREAQAELARTHGVSGFCYYHYWFNGRRLLYRPFDEVLRSGSPDFPFCLCWANENWTRRWDGGNDVVLVPQEHSLEDDQRHIEHLLPAFRDRRYIKIDGRPLLLIYRTALLPAPAATAALWRKRVEQAGFPGLYLARVESWADYTDPRSIGFDAGVEFAPDFGVAASPPIGQRWDLLGKIRYRWRRALRLHSRLYDDNVIRLYETLVERMTAKPASTSYPRFRCVTPGWDNSPRRGAVGARILHGSTPQAYETWLKAMVCDTRRSYTDDKQILFINAWNEWGEGNHLEPDQRWGREYLAATQRALNSDYS